MSWVRRRFESFGAFSSLSREESSQMFLEGLVEGVQLVSLGQHRDFRGSVSRFFENGTLVASQRVPVDYSLVSKNPHRGTLRGFHFQKGDFAEAKLFRCVSGKLLDVIVDVREDSETFLNFMAVELDSDENRSLFVPAGCANAWMTLTDHTIVLYGLSGSYSPSSESGLRFDDPGLPPVWPFEPLRVSEKDQTWPDFQLPEA